MSACPIDHTALQTTDCPISANAVAFDPFTGPYQVDPAGGSLSWSRDEEPVFYSPPDLGYWVVTRYEDVKAVFRDNILFSPSIALEKITPPVSDEATATLAKYGYAMARTLVNEDEPAHMPRRRVLMDPFTPKELVHHEPMVRRLTREYVDRFIESGKADLVDEMLWEVPLTVALHFLGVPEEDMDTMRKYSIAHTVNTWGGDRRPSSRSRSRRPSASSGSTPDRCSRRCARTRPATAGCRSASESSRNNPTSSPTPTCTR